MKKLIASTVLSLIAVAGVAFAQSADVSANATSTPSGVSTGVAMDMKTGDGSGHVLSEAEQQVKALRVEMEAKIKAIRTEYQAKFDALRKAAKDKAATLRKAAADAREKTKEDVKAKRDQIKTDAKAKMDQIKQNTKAKLNEVKAPLRPTRPGPGASGNATSTAPVAP